MTRTDNLPRQFSDKSIEPETLCIDPCTKVHLSMNAKQFKQKTEHGQWQ
jgi:hypothetical protein